MKLVKRLLTGLGVVFCLLLLLVGALVYFGRDFQREHEPFVRSFMAEYSQHWDARDVQDLLATEYLEQIQSPEGEAATAFFRRLGAIEDLTDVSLENFYAGSEGKTGIFVFKARFEAAPAVVRLTVRESDDGVRVLGLHVTPVGDLLPSGPTPTDI